MKGIILRGEYQEFQRDITWRLDHNTSVLAWRGDDLWDLPSDRVA